jgi:hypothetical protein
MIEHCDTAMRRESLKVYVIDPASVSSVVSPNLAQPRASTLGQLQYQHPAEKVKRRNLTVDVEVR